MTRSSRLGHPGAPGVPPRTPTGSTTELQDAAADVWDTLDHPPGRLDEAALGGTAA